jgi:cobalamin-dependent methionine synthase I
MIIIGELINASRKAIKAAIEAQDAAAIQQVARDQAEAGADYIDVNAGIFVGKEPEYLRWLVETVQQATDKPCAIDSPDPSAIEAALSAHQGTPMINSISLEKDRYDKLMPIIAGTDMKVIALCMSDAGMPQTVDDRMRIADELVGGLQTTTSRWRTSLWTRWCNRCLWTAPSGWSSSTRLKRSWRPFPASTRPAGFPTSATGCRPESS